MHADKVSQDGEAHVGFPQENVFARAFIAQYLMEQRTSATARSSDAAPGEGSGEAAPGEGSSGEAAAWDDLDDKDWEEGPAAPSVGGWQVVTDGHAVMPEGMTHLPDEAFHNRTSLVSVACPRSLASIGSGAFEGCSSLSSIDLPAGLTSINNYAFRGCSALSSVTLPAGLTSIDGAFYGCSSLARITLPAGLTSIGDDAFRGCASLASVTVPTTATVGYEAFEPETSASRPDGAARQRDRTSSRATLRWRLLAVQTDIRRD